MDSWSLRDVACKTASMSSREVLEILAFLLESQGGCLLFDELRAHS